MRVTQENRAVSDSQQNLDIPIPFVGRWHYSRAEMIADGVVHAVGIVLAISAGSALLALAVDFGELDAEGAWAAGHVDEDWQIEQWGQDAEAVARRSARKRDMMAAAGLLEALKG